ncbi:MAG: riboflavin synthase [Deltaproteobacteria bacterium]|nr:riboflavin synthase [Deltaproteobacteria bacterium]
MFTGIIEDLGHLARREPLQEGQRLWVRTVLPVAELQMGASVALSGACMTVVAMAPAAGQVGSAAQGEFAVDVSAESLRRTTLGDLREGDPINLERSMRLGDHVGGHMVSGHVDGTGSVISIVPEGESSLFTFGVDPSLMAMLVEKGSVAVDGISLTCFNCRADRFDVAIIPHTFAVTTLGVRGPGARVNIEVDVMGKYVAKLVDAAIAARLAK